MKTFETRQNCNRFVSRAVKNNLYESETNRDYGWKDIFEKAQ